MPRRLGRGIKRVHIARMIRDETGVDVATCNKMINAFLRAVYKVLYEEGFLSFRGWGYFKVIQCKARKCGNPQTGISHFIPACKRIKFKACAGMLKLLNKKEGEGAKTEAD